MPVCIEKKQGLQVQDTEASGKTLLVTAEKAVTRGSWYGNDVQRRSVPLRHEFPQGCRQSVPLLQIEVTVALAVTASNKRPVNKRVL
ncbi:hypothetical protein NDU88_004204 [Pleurodeles waltl]|uniref:Uncharacterized protein n=1 Tax=Pleurodeles waltl TaxID=8319 RepID=A0AAV7UEQ6_PLEWA|nr:hypothetical protein NDU88_004204 [Pleurodeles waltl]